MRARRTSSSGVEFKLSKTKDMLEEGWEEGLWNRDGIARLNRSAERYCIFRQWYRPGYLWGCHDLDGSEKRLESRLDPKNDIKTPSLIDCLSTSRCSDVKADISGPIGKDRLVTVLLTRTDMKPCPARNEAADILGATFNTGLQISVLYILHVAALARGNPL